MRRRLSPALFVLLLVGSVATAAEDFTGKWSGAFTGTDRMGNPIKEAFVLNFVQKDAELTGTIGPSEGEQWKITKGKVTGNSLYFELQTSDMVLTGGVMKFTLSLAEGRLKGDVTGEEGSKKMTLKVDAARVKQ